MLRREAFDNIYFSPWFCMTVLDTHLTLLPKNNSDVQKISNYIGFFIRKGLACRFTNSSQQDGGFSIARFPLSTKERFNLLSCGKAASWCWECYLWLKHVVGFSPQEGNKEAEHSRETEF